MKVIPDRVNEPMWIRLALTEEQISSLPRDRPIKFIGSAEIQYISKHDIGGRSNVEIRIKELALGEGNV